MCAPKLLPVKALPSTRIRLLLRSRIVFIFFGVLEPLSRCFERRFHRREWAVDCMPPGSAAMGVHFISRHERTVRASHAPQHVGSPAR